MASVRLSACRNPVCRSTYSANVTISGIHTGRSISFANSSAKNNPARLFGKITVTPSNRPPYLSIMSRAKI